MKRIVTLDVSCPSCGSAPGRVCKRADGVATSPHDTRRRRARDEDLRLNPEHTAGQLPLLPVRGRK